MVKKLESPVPVEKKGKRKLSAPEKRREKARKRLLKQIYTLDTRHLIAKVGFILNQMPKTRDNDKLLTVEIYKTFYDDYLIDRDKIRLDDLLILPKSYEMQRYRAHIQNVLGLFRASPDVQKKRKVRRKEWREEGTAILTPPIEIFAGQSGTDSPHLVLGSIWFYDRLKNHSVLKEFKDFREKNLKNHRLKFSKVTNRNQKISLEFFDLIMKYQDIIGFKAHIFHNYLDKVDSVHEAFLEHILESMDSEIEKKKIDLPKSLSIIKNQAQDDDSDMIEEVHKKMNKILQDKHEQELFIDQFFLIETESSPLLQIADFFTGAIHHLYGNKVGKKKPRDIFAREIVKKLGINSDTCLPKRKNKRVNVTII